MDEARIVREFWFGPSWTGTLPAADDPASTRDSPCRAELLRQRTSLWFAADPRERQRRDEAIRSQFLQLLQRAARGDLTSWADGPRRRLSLILLLDQFPRHIYRATAQAFAYDDQALGLTMSAMQLAADAALNVIERIFFYMPLQHAESLEAQEESVAAYKRLLAESPSDLRKTFQSALDSALTHRELIRRFGRFPDRNRPLGRQSTQEEEAYLRAHPQSL